MDTPALLNEGNNSPIILTGIISRRIKKVYY